MGKIFEQVKNREFSDLSLFKNRLLRLMNEKGIKTVKELATELCEFKLVHVKTRPKDEVLSEKEILTSAIKSTEKKIQEHLHSDDCSSLQGEFVMAYCQFFGCSSDYLFGYIKCKTHISESVHKQTRLSEKAVEKLLLPEDNVNSVPKEYVDFLSHIIENKDFERLCRYSLDIANEEKIVHTLSESIKQGFKQMFRDTPTFIFKDEEDVRKYLEQRLQVTFLEIVKESIPQEQ